MNFFFCQMMVTFRDFKRDRLFHALLGIALFLMFLVPVFSVFSMRQVQELSITLSLSSISFVLLFVAVMLGSSSLWRDIERRYASSVLTLPVSRTSYVCGKFVGIALVIVICSLLLGAVASLAILFCANQYPSELGLHWDTIWLAIAGESLKYIMLAASALFFSSISTSFFLPFFGTLSIYFIGNSSQEVFEYVSGSLGQQMAPAARVMIESLYYVVPNFAGFDLKVHATYGLSLNLQNLLFPLAYFVIYVVILIYAAICVFEKRQIT